MKSFSILYRDDRISLLTLFCMYINRSLSLSWSLCGSLCRPPVLCLRSGWSACRPGVSSFAESTSSFIACALWIWRLAGTGWSSLLFLFFFLPWVLSLSPLVIVPAILSVLGSSLAFYGNEADSYHISSGQSGSTLRRAQARILFEMWADEHRRLTSKGIYAAHETINRFSAIQKAFLFFKWSWLRLSSSYYWWCRVDRSSISSVWAYEGR